MRPEILNFLFNDISLVHGIGPKLSKLVKSLCGSHLINVLWHLPSNVIHRPLLKNLNQIQNGMFCTLYVEIDNHIIPPTKRQPYRILGHVGSWPIELVFFNYHKDYLTQILPAGETRWVSGKIDYQMGLVKMLHPDYITTDFDKIPEFEAVYPLTGGITSKVLSKIIHTALKHLPVLPEWLDETFKKKAGLPDWHLALDQVHHPHTMADLSPLSAYRKRLAYDELLANQLALLMVREKMKKKRGFCVAGDGRLSRQVIGGLPFELTNAQKRVLNEIKADAASEHKMLRLLQGDVGAGKTMVALMALLNAVEAGFQGVIMAPTDILARQHLDTFKRYCDPLGVQVALLTGREKGQKRKNLLDDIKNGNINILIGTHAVFVEDVFYHNLGLVVIDEQHKFGVKQRLALTDKQAGVDLLVMTATPIPRTLALTTYGDMDMSKLDEKPAGRQPIETRVLSVSKLDEVVQKIHQLTLATDQRVQAYWICPLVEESEKSDLMAVEKRYSELRQVFKDRVGLVHGKMKGPQKDAVMNAFAAGQLDVLVSTTVIEVGVDVKTASIMVVEHAERFGLSQLHQLRGRIGRGSDKSTCLLMYAGRLSDTAKARLKVMRESEDGFLIAEEDLKLRGAGEMLGAKQSGLQEFQLADLSVHGDLLWTATKDAKTILSLDPQLKSFRGQALRILLYLFQKDSQINMLTSG